ncbi:MAG TPA: hypothetical protein VJ044_03080 [Candidatus Hodarchaeales archaeon]|nr:hypothetical protein [Candidatus Hodarchaeales archaeon]
MPINVSYDQYINLGMRIAKIISVDKIPKSDRLLKLTIKLNDDTQRIFLAGINQHYDHQSLVGS